MKILVTPTSMTPDKDTDALRKLKAYTEDLVFNPTGKPLSGDALVELLKDCDGYLAGLDSVTGDVLKQCPKLKAISRYGAGYDRVDIAAAKKMNIKVSNTSGANAQAVAELAFGMLISLSRQIPYLHTETISGKWIRSNGKELYGKTIGIVGLGAIGKKLAHCCKGFDMKILAYDPFINEEYCRENGITVCSLEELLAQSDYVSLHLPLTESTRHLIDAKAIASMKKGAILINASRGGIIDENAAYEGLISGQLGGLGLDAFETEPPAASPLFRLNNVVATPHAGAHTAEATQAMAGMAVDNLIEMLENGDCKFIVNR